jgi:hypothetical protein
MSRTAIIGSCITRDIWRECDIPLEDVLYIIPASMSLYLNYPHAADGLTYTDAPLAMDLQDNGAIKASFDTKVCEPGTVFASMRGSDPSSAADLKITITANPANPGSHKPTRRERF